MLSKTLNETMDEILFLVMIIIIWVVFFLLVYIYNKTYSLKRKNYDSLVIVHQNCYSFNAQHIYLIKLYYGRPLKKFFFWTNITLDFLDETDQTYSTINIPSKVLFESQKHGFSEKPKNKEKFMAFILQTKTSLEQTRSLRVKHDNRSADLFIYRIKIIDLIRKDSFNVMVNSHVKFLPPGAHPRAQTYNCTSSLKNKTDIKPSPYLNFSDILLFFFVGIHAIMFHIQYKIIDYYLLNRKTNEISRNETLLEVSLLSLSSALFASILIAVLLLNYYLIIKRCYSEFRGIGLVWIIERTYRWTAVIIAVILGILASFRRQINWPIKTKNSGDKDKIKLVAMTFAIIIYSVAFFTIVLISQYFGFMKKPEEYDLESEDEVSSQADKLSEEPVIRSESNMTFKPDVSSFSDSQNDKNLTDDKPNDDKQNDKKIPYMSVGSDFKTNP